MSHNTFFISDLHFGHKNVLSMSPCRGGTTVEEHDEWIIDQWNSVVRKRDTIWVLGDVAFNAGCLENFKRMRGQKMLIMGNHDKSAKVLLPYFNSIFGTKKHKGFWLSHCPIHPAELRGSRNIHGHVHNETILEDGDGWGRQDPNYINVCVEVCNGVPISLDEIKRR